MRTKPVRQLSRDEIATRGGEEAIETGGQVGARVLFERCLREHGGAYTEEAMSRVLEQMTLDSRRIAGEETRR
jgi:hypothetical protein